GEVQMGPDGPVRMYGTARDITERKLAELDRARLEQEMLKLAEQERQRVGHDLHDDLGQILTGIAFLAKSMETKLSARSLPESASMSEISSLAQEAIAKARNLSRGLAPVTLEPGGFVAAINELAATTERLFGVRCTFEYDETV